jgi:hypothetical protein
MRQEIKKYTLNDMQYIDKILEAFCDKYEKTKQIIIKGRNNELDFKKKQLSKKAREFFEKEGFEIEEVTDFGYHRKEIVAGIPVEIAAIDKGRKDYKKGVQVSILCAGESRKSLQEDIDRKERALINYLNKFGIPLNRLCVESALQCEHKFSGMACEVAN